MQLPDSEITTREVTEWQGLHLLHNNLSSCSQKVRILMGELGIDYVSHQVNLLRDEQRTEWYLGINPNGLVPVLVHDGAVHIESNDIIEYLDQHFSKQGQSLLPTSESEQQDMHTLMDLEARLHPDLRTITFTYLAPDPSDHAPGVAADDFGYIQRFHEACTMLDSQLQDQPFLLGERITLADVSWFITLYRLNLAGYPMANHANIHGFQRIAQRPTCLREVQAGPAALRAAATAYRSINRWFRKSLSRDYSRWQATTS